MNIAKVLKEQRELKGLTQGELAHLVGASREMISYIEKGYKLPSLQLAARLSSVLGCSLDYLVFGKSA